MKIVDSHIHFWDSNELQYDWLAGLSAINRPFLPQDLSSDAAEIALEKIVFVQCDCIPEQSMQEVAWVSSLAQNEPRIQAIVAFAPLEQGDRVQEHLQKLTQYPLVKGVRRLIQSEGDGFCIQPDFVKSVQLLAAFGYSFDICIMHHQMGDVLKLVEKCPDVSFVLDHIGKPGIKDGLRDPWQDQIAALAAFPNVACKISGLVTEADWEAWTRAEFKPYSDHVIAIFGPDKVMYGGDWPVSTLATSYQEWYQTLNWATIDLSIGARHKLFYQNAISFYGLT